MLTTAKKTILMLSVLISSACFSQTKQETEDWILQKLRKYKVESERAEFFFDGSNLNIVWKNTSELKTKEQFIIPVWAIQNILLTSENGVAKITFHVDKYCTGCKGIIEGRKKRYKKEYYYETKYGWEQGRQVSRKVEKSKRVPDGYETYRDEKTQPGGFKFRFKSTDPEENFINRLNKAIRHLQTLYPKKPANKETF